MNRPVKICGALVAVILWAQGSAIATRIWTDSTGQFKVDADFVSLENGVVTLKKGDGTDLQLPLAKLSKPDQEIVSKLENHRLEVAKPGIAQKAGLPQRVAAEVPPDVKALMEQLSDVDVVKRFLAAKSLGGMGPKAKEALSALMKTAKNDPDAKVRSAADDAIADIVGAAAAAQPLVVDWTEATNEVASVVAAFPVPPQYTYHISAEFGRVKEWKCTSKAGLKVSFQMLQKTVGDQAAIATKIVGAKVAISLDKNLCQEFASPTLLARISFANTGFMALTFAVKGRDLLPDEIAMFRKWGSDLQGCLACLESKTSEDTVRENANSWVINDEKGRTIAAFAKEPEYHYGIETLPHEDRKGYVLVRDWKCTSNGAIMWFRLYIAPDYTEDMGNVITQVALRQAQVAFDVHKQYFPGGLETITPNFVARMSWAYPRSGVLSVKANGRELTRPELNLYESWETDLPSGNLRTPDRRHGEGLDALEKYLLAKTRRQNKKPGWPITIGGLVNAGFPSKPTHRSSLTKNHMALQEWTSTVGQVSVSFYTATISDAQRVEDSHDMKQWLSTKFGLENLRNPTFCRLKSNLLMETEVLGEPNQSKTTAILAITSKGTLSQSELELYDSWHADAHEPPAKTFQAIADFLEAHAK